MAEKHLVIGAVKYPVELDSSLPRGEWYLRGNSIIDFDEDMMMPKTLYDLGIKNRFIEWLKWSPYFFWQYGFGFRYVKAMWHAKWVIFLPPRLPMQKIARKRRDRIL